MEIKNWQRKFDGVSESNDYTLVIYILTKINEHKISRFQNVQTVSAAHSEGTADSKPGEKAVAEGGSPLASTYGLG